MDMWAVKPQTFGHFNRRR